MKLPDSYAVTEMLPAEGFEDVYIKLRTAEKRIYSDDELILLPDISSDHPHFKEWLIRKQSSEKLVTFLAKKDRPLKILEAGCGNGWLSHQLSTIEGSQVTGIDINFTELVQAVKTFHHISNLTFIPGNIRTPVFSDPKFDIIVFAASIQYFSSFNEIILLAMQLLKPNGEVHILDSPFYKAKEVGEARERTKKYFNNTGFPEMAANYYHHCLDELDAFDHHILYDPGGVKNKFYKNRSPFPWICIRKK